jgi:putative molybdopterin biosynthesis protein
VRAAATALGLDFIPVASEQYDLLVARRFFESERGELLMEIIRSAGFKHAVAALGGYDPGRAGEVFYRH